MNLRRFARHPRWWTLIAIVAASAAWSGALPADELKDGHRALDSGQLDLAQKYFEEAASKGRAEGRAGVGLVLLKRRKLDEAMEAFKTSEKMDPNLPLSYYGEGEVYRRRGDCDKARPLLEKATTMDTKFPEAELALGACLVKDKEIDRAIKALTRGLKWGSKWRPRFLVALGDAELARDSLRDAGIYLHTAVQEAPDDPVPQRALGDFYVARGTFELAIPYYQSAIDKDSTDVVLRYKLGQAQFYAQRYNAALETYKDVVARDSEYAPGQLALGDLYYRSGQADRRRYEDARAPLEAYTKLMPNDPKGWSLLGRTYYNLGMKDEALDAMNKAESLGDRTKEMYLFRARAHVDRQEWDAALQDYGRADPQAEDQLRIAQVLVFKGEPQRAESLYTAIADKEGTSNYGKFALNELGKLEFRNKKYEKAIDRFQQLISLDPKDDEAYYYIGLSYKEMKRYDESLKALAQAVSLAPDKADRHFWLGILYAQLDSVPQARVQLQKAVDLDAGGKSRNTGIALRQLGFYLLLEKKYDEAANLLERAVQIDDKDVQAWVWLGQGQQNSGNRVRACEAYHRALAIEPAQPDALRGIKSLGC